MVLGLSQPIPIRAWNLRQVEGGKLFVSRKKALFPRELVTPNPLNATADLGLEFEIDIRHSPEDEVAPRILNPKCFLKMLPVRNPDCLHVPVPTLPLGLALPTLTGPPVLRIGIESDCG